MENLFETYTDILLEWNGKINLTAITDRREIEVKHFEDSLTCAEYIPIGATVVDVGTGAGFPGVPIKLKRGDIQLTLMDALQKRTVFLRELCTRLQIQTDCVHIRAEDAGGSGEYRESFDVAVSRAVTGLAALAEYCLPLVKPGGLMLAMKGKACETEISEAEPLIKTLGGKITKVALHTLSDQAITHSIIIIEKIHSTPEKYPRRGKKVGK